MVHCRGGTFEPVVIAIDEDYDTLLDDFDYIFRQIIPSSRSLGLKEMKPQILQEMELGTRKPVGMAAFVSKRKSTRGLATPEIGTGVS